MDLINILNLRAIYIRRSHHPLQVGQRHPPVLGQEPEGGGPAADALPQAQVPRPLRREALRDHEGELRAGR